jgi:precorrin-2 dehydrogenase/sirohydrochlorin ferrochelatase
MPKYAIFLELSGRRVVVVGAGNVALRKLRRLVATGAQAVVVAEHIGRAVRAVCAGKSRKGSCGSVRLIEAGYAKKYLAGAALVFAATNDGALNQQVCKDCRQLGILCNVVDDPDYCDFIVPAVVQRGDLQMAVSTGGKCPAYASQTKRKLEKLFSPQHGRFLDELGKLRAQILSELNPGRPRKALLQQLASEESFACFVRYGSAKWVRRARKMLAEQLKAAEENGG